jgi:plastocyanin
MICRWLIFFSVFHSLVPLSAATVTGHVQLRDSRDPSVKNHGDYSGVVVWLKPIASPSPGSVAQHRATITQKDKTFSPHVTVITAGSSIAFPNLDPIFHNAFSSYSGQIFDVGLYPPGTSRSVRFTREGVVRVFCNIHASMSAVIVVLSTPYFAVTGRDGAFAIPDVPAGDYELNVFHERATEGALTALTQRIAVGGESLAVPPLTISEAGYLPIPHKNKFGRDYPPDSGNAIYPGVKK